MALSPTCAPTDSTLATASGPPTDPAREPTDARAFCPITAAPPIRAVAPTATAPMTGTSPTFDSRSVGFSSATAGVKSTGAMASTLDSSTTGAGVVSTVAGASATRGRGSEPVLAGETGGEAEVKVEGSTEMRAAAAIPAAPRKPEAIAVR